MECYCYLRNVQDPLADGRTPFERRSGESFKARSFRLVQWLKIILFLRRTSQGSTTLVRKFYQEYCSDIGRGRNWKGDILVADIEELGNLSASELHARRLNARNLRVYESSSSRRKYQKLFIWTFNWNLENLVKIYHGTSTPRGSDTKWHCGKSSTKRRTRNFSSVAAIRIG